MAYDDTYGSRLKQLLRDPRRGLRKVVPFTQSRIMPYWRRGLEAIGITTLSAPYMGHAALLQYMGISDTQHKKIQKQSKGLFIEVGGNDGYGNDPTYYLERVLGWKGMIVEPLPIYKLCKKNRPGSTVYNCATSSFENKEATLSFIDCNAMSFVAGSLEAAEEQKWISDGERTQHIKARKITVPVKPVQALIDEYQKYQTERRDIDLFVADVEGYELNVLRGLDFTKNSPRFILLEINTPDRLAAITDYLTGKKYTLRAEIGHHDYLFRRNDQPLHHSSP